MVIKLLIKEVIFVTVLNSCFAKQEAFWRIYDGIIPKDAFDAGIYDSGTIYIGQIYLNGLGLVPVEIQPGESEASTYLNGTYTNDIRIILCTQEIKAYEWIKTNSESYTEDTKLHQPVIRGFESRMDDYGSPALKTIQLHLGRVNIDGKLFIGKITAYSTLPVLRVFDGQTELEFSLFEFLNYNDIPY